MNLPKDGGMPIQMNGLRRISIIQPNLRKMAIDLFQLRASEKNLKCKMDSQKFMNLRGIPEFLSQLT